MILIDRKSRPANRASKPHKGACHFEVQGKPFTLQVNSGSSVDGDVAAKHHMKKVEDLITSAASQKPELEFRFLNQSSFGFTI